MIGISDQFLSSLIYIGDLPTAKITERGKWDLREVTRNRDVMSVRKFRNKDNHFRKMNSSFRKLIVVFKSKEYRPRDINEGPTNTTGGSRWEGKDVSGSYIDYLRSVVVFCKTSKTFKNMAVVFRNTEKYFRNKAANQNHTNNPFKKLVVVFKNKNKGEDSSKTKKEF